jgi:hypothetical protein
MARIVFLDQLSKAEEELSLKELNTLVRGAGITYIAEHGESFWLSLSEDFKLGFRASGGQLEAVIRKEPHSQLSTKSMVPQ